MRHRGDRPVGSCVCFLRDGAAWPGVHELDPSRDELTMERPL